MALCPEWVIASQGMSVSGARENLKAAIELGHDAAAAVLFGYGTIRIAAP